MVKDIKVLEKVDKIYINRGYDSQINKFNEEFGEMIAAIARFQSKAINKSELFKDLISEIADYELIKLQLDRNVNYKERIYFMEVLISQDRFIKDLNFKHTWKRIRYEHKSSIKRIMIEKIDRTLDRIDKKYY